MRAKIFVLSIILSQFIYGAAMAKANDADLIIKKMLSVIDIPSLSCRQNIRFERDGQTVSQWSAIVEKKNIDKKINLLLSITQPDSIIGTAFLLRKLENNSFVLWSYFPPFRRVQKISGFTMYDNFLGTDFNYSDFGFMFVNGVHKVIGEEERDGVMVYKIETIPKENNYLYSKIHSWVSKETYVPIVQDFYDLSGRLWKRQTRKHFVVIDEKLSVALQTRMIDLQNDTSTTIEIDKIMTDAERLMDDAFMPERLKYASKQPV